MSGNNCKAKNRLPRDLCKRLASYSTMAAGISLAFAPHANAAAKCNILGTSLTVDTGSGNVYIDIDGDGNKDFYFEAFYDSGTYTASVNIWRVNEFAKFDATGWDANRLSQGETVNATQAVNNWAHLLYATSGNWNSGQFTDGQEGYIGVRFNIPDVGDRNGWILFKGGTDKGASISGEIKGWGYEDADAASYAGDNCTGPTLVELASFTAASLDDSVQLSWETASEIDCAGFHILRSKSEGGIFTRITESLIPSKGEASQGAAYSYRDGDVDFGQTYYYRLEDIDYDGQSTIHDAVSITVEHGILLVSPEDGAKHPLYLPVTFKWDSAGLERFKLGFSTNPDFTGKVIMLPQGSKRNGRWITSESYTPNRKEWRKIQRLGRRGGTVHWAVFGEDEAGESVTSAAFGLKIGAPFKSPKGFHNSRN